MASRRSALTAIGRQFRPLLDGWGNALATLVILVTACVLLPDVFEWSIPFVAEKISEMLYHLVKPDRKYDEKE